ncbi:acyl-CoA N-acyltransferase [Anaeromyces robustus]|uniref:Acyl-CoA N-acyltransferase n=1 Tax=Anaeromyces robustus TaxID=1754192 RepID=A0A1Y1XPD1_9FUNG|nr:acyl-CoA N-acyltransferase [Anaeromyces robustus]|eukprot:ORX87376.1 acyl-CoA N-acyltransferase [Anaeromyces robustus]
MSVSLGDLTPNNIKQLKLLNSVLFPEISLSEKYYQDCLNKTEWSQFGYFSDVNVGATSYCEEEIPEDKDNLRVYIYTLGVLPAYRRLGVGSKLLQYIFDNCKENNKIKQIYLHIPTNNESALNFYKKHGFEIKETIKDYYDKSESNRDAYILIKNL